MLTCWLVNFSSFSYRLLSRAHGRSATEIDDRTLETRTRNFGRFWVMKWDFTQPFQVFLHSSLRLLSHFLLSAVPPKALFIGVREAGGFATRERRGTAAYGRSAASSTRAAAAMDTAAGSIVDGAARVQARGPRWGTRGEEDSTLLSLLQHSTSWMQFQIYSLILETESRERQHAILDYTRIQSMRSYSHKSATPCCLSFQEYCNSTFLVHL